jgi:NAD+ synthase (glutamine-hydrolysing)
MRLALAQINPTVGDLVGNAAIIARFTDMARQRGADLVVFPELCLTGYPPKDLILQEGFIEAAAAEAKRLGEGHSAGITLVFGVPLPASRNSGASGVANSLLAYRDGKMLAYYDKRLLPTYDVFDEDRYFVPGNRAVIIDVAGVRVGLSICEDLWRGEDVGFSERYRSLADPVLELAAPPDGRPGADIIVNPSASPFVLGKGKRHRELLRSHAVRHDIYIAAVNQVGGNDELIFDGHAAVFDPGGVLVAAGPGFEEALTVVDIAPGAWKPPQPYSDELVTDVTEDRGMADPLLVAPDEKLLLRALVLGTRDYCRKTGFTSAVIGLSGGIDSAVTCAIAALALGPENITGVLMPSRYSSEGSITDAVALGGALGVRHVTVPIEGPFAAMLEALEGPLASGPDGTAGVTEENLQSRLRGTIIMAFSNRTGSIVLTTGNKSELAVGYATLYGDMNGGLAVLSDVTKEHVYRLARWMNACWKEAGFSGPPIPKSSITKPPSAELRPDQTDQDTLPPYPALDEIIERYVVGRQSPQRIAAETGFDAATVARVVRMIDLSEYKRKQAALGLKVTGVAFGTGRRFPIAQRYRPEGGMGR